MGLLRWTETEGARPFLRAEIVNLNLNFIDLCEGRFWGGSQFYFQLKFSIHERIVKNNNWNYSLLVPNGVHIYCKDIAEAKELAEVIYQRIINALSEQINNPDIAAVPQVNRNRFCKNTKHKFSKLFDKLRERGIEGRVFYSRRRGNTGWMFNHSGCEPILLGSNYEQAADMIDSGTLDFYRGQ